MSKNDWSLTNLDKLRKYTTLWTRPNDWLTLPTLTEGQERAVILNAVYPGSDNNIACIMSTGYPITIDWGDGTIENFNASILATHVYTYSSVSDTTLCSRGYKQVIISITPQVSGKFTAIYLANRPNGYPNTYSTSYLDIAAVGSNLTTCSWTNVTLRLLEKFTFIGTNKITSFSSAFSDCNSLGFVNIDTSLGTNFYGMFSNCYSLQTIPLLNTANGTNFTGMFSGCYSLQTIPLLNTANGTNFSGMFLSCSSLKTIPILDTHLGTSFSQMFYTCTSLQTIPLLNTANGTNFSQMFGSCSSLQIIPLLDTHLGTSFSSIFSGCTSLMVGTLSGTSKTISYSSCKLSRQAIVNIFNNLASGVSSQTITISSNPGTSSLTSDDRLIATNKGWTISG